MIVLMEMFAVYSCRCRSLRDAKAEELDPLGESARTMLRFVLSFSLCFVNFCCF